MGSRKRIEVLCLEVAEVKIEDLELRIADQYSKMRAKEIEGIENIESACIYISLPLSSVFIFYQKLLEIVHIRIVVAKCSLVLRLNMGRVHSSLFAN